MKTFIITTKEDNDCYTRICENWFEDSSLIPIHTDSSVISTSLQPEYNYVRVKKDENFRLCLPSCLNPHIPQDKKVDYVLSLICEIVKKLNVPKSELYLVIHAGDLFDQKDGRRITGHVRFNWIHCTPDILTAFQETVEEAHFYQFRHNGNDVSDLLLEPEIEDIPSLCESLIEIIG